MLWFRGKFLQAVDKRQKNFIDLCKNSKSTAINHETLKSFSRQSSEKNIKSWFYISTQY